MRHSRRLRRLYKPWQRTISYWEPDRIKVTWRRGNRPRYRVTLWWYINSAGPQLTVMWYCDEDCHRLDGPSCASTKQASYKDGEYLGRLTSPYLIDDWFRNHEADFVWYVFDMWIDERSGLLTDRFPYLTTDCIYFRILVVPADALRWIRVARSLGLLDSRLIHLERQANVLDELL